jgi:hypothetical protein
MNTIPVNITVFSVIFKTSQQFFLRSTGLFMQRNFLNRVQNPQCAGTYSTLRHIPPPVYAATNMVLMAIYKLRL